ncbi:Crp/Fnr family transcriptional regulator [Hathewaya histolytica]|uniref:Crp/Fnr family transcriptional regulator n=1 Tax=Hathewaya histolytica TaxID=1498 RepID=UPI003B68316E
MLKILSKSILFKGFNEDVIDNMISKINYKISHFSKGEIIALEGDDIRGIGIILDGTIEVQKGYPSGKVISVNRIGMGGIFGEVIIFSNLKHYPSNIISFTSSKVMFIPKEDILKLCSLSEGFLTRFMTLLSNKILMLNKKLKEVSYGTIREKLADFILDQYKSQENFKITLKQKRNEMAEHFGVTRPSLSRELIKMKEEGLIDFEKNVIIIKDLEKIEEVLY